MEDTCQRCAKCRDGKCIQYGIPTEKAYDKCKEDAEKAMEKMLTEQEKEISKLETDYTGEYRRVGHY